MDQQMTTQLRKVPPGGPATNDGIVYQMLWSLLRTSRLRIGDQTRHAATGELTAALLVLEPIGGGGDLVLQTPVSKVVEQLKTRSDAGTWSLREVVESVLPDLYLAAVESSQDIEFRFVTEVRMGQWKAAYFSDSFSAARFAFKGKAWDMSQWTCSGLQARMKRCGQPFVNYLRHWSVHLSLPKVG